MNNKKLLILGGYGNTGRPMAELLLQHSSADLVIAGRNLKKAESLAGELNALYPWERVSGRYVDASKTDVLLEAFTGVNMVVVASSTVDFTEQVAGTALEAGIDYFDVQYSTHKFDVLQALSGQIEQAGLCFITDGGFHPGLPAALVRFLAPNFDRLEKANVGSAIKIDWAALELAPSTMAEFVAEFADFQTLVFRDGRWQKAGVMSMMKPITVDFGPKFGRQYCIPMFLEEMRAIPELVPGIAETGFFVGSLNWFVDWFVSPIVMVAMKLWPVRARQPMGRFMFWGLKTFSRPPYGTLLKAEGRGAKDGKEKTIDLILYHEDGYAFTAIPAAACLLQYLDDSIRHPGLWLQGNVVEPERLMVDMEKMGIQIN